MAKSRSSKGIQGSRPGEAPAAKLKVKLSLDREVLRLLRLEAFGRDCSLGQVVEELVRSSPRRFVLTDRGVRGLPGPEGYSSPSADGVQKARGDVLALGVVSEAG
jgi:hypothetical protein